MRLSLRTSLLALSSLLSLLPSTSYAQEAVRWISSTDDKGNTVYLRDDRRPALYTGNFGDCLGKSLINVTRFDAAFYRDNMTVLFHLAGNTALRSENLMCMSRIGLFSPAPYFAN